MSSARSGSWCPRFPSTTSRSCCRSCHCGVSRRPTGSRPPRNFPVLLSIVPLRSFEEADYLSHEVPDISIPQQTLTAMERAGSRAAQTGIELAAGLLAEARPLVRGVVLTVPGSDPAVLDQLLGGPA